MSPLLLVIIAGWPFFLLQNPFFIRRPQLKPSQKREWLLKTKSTGDCCIHSGSKHPTKKSLIPKPTKTTKIYNIGEEFILTVPVEVLQMIIV